MSSFYKFTYNLQLKILNNNSTVKRKVEQVSKCSLILFFVLFVLYSLGIYFLPLVLRLFFSILLFLDIIICLISEVLIDPLYSLTHKDSKGKTPGLVRLAVKVCFLVFLLMFIMVFVFAGLISFEDFLVVFTFLLIPYLVTLFVYITIMCIGECKVVSVVNGIFSALLSLFLLIKSFVLNVLPPNYFEVSQLKGLVELCGYSYSQAIDIGIMALVLPIVVMTTCGFVFPLGKKLWLDSNAYDDLVYTEIA